MLTIRMQRTGRKGYASFRIVVQDSKFTPTSGRVVAQVGHSNPHTKETVLDTEKIEHYLKNGAQPSPRVVRLLLAAKVSLPSWVAIPKNEKTRKTKNTDKLRKHMPKEEVVADAEVPASDDAENNTTEKTEETVEENKTEDKAQAAPVEA